MTGRVSAVLIPVNEVKAYVAVNILPNRFMDLKKIKYCLGSVDLSIQIGLNLKER